MIRTYKRKLCLTVAQTKRLESWIGTARMLYNLGMEVKIAAYKANGSTVTKYDLGKQITQLKKDYSWIADLPVSVTESVFSQLDNSFNRFFRTAKTGGGFPKYASKRKYKSIKLKQSSGVIRIDGHHLNLQKIGTVRLVKDAPIQGDIFDVTIKVEPTGMFAFIGCKNVPPQFVSENQAIGLDMGISKFCIDSNGGFIENPQHFKRYERQLRIENRALARKKKGSNSWKKQSKRLSLLHHKIGNVRRDFLHKESTKIAKANSVVYLEDLKIVNMARNGNLSKHILDAGWGAFRTILDYKTNVFRVNPKHTSQTCHECGHVDSKSRISQAEFVCTECGHISNADVNAAKNILSKGIALDRKREPIGCALVLEPTNNGKSAYQSISFYNY